ncbi:MAG: TetR family transcriptional regulator C-terminal domain-containing protein [Gemmataceae bacterium]|nr:TetR family transcriptional regulator C-terminal domain-containing protein [Gemmataceae bacterium]MDW8265542.1 TetR family transcriptional regulator C-terminal domain-containing protein [Gemmataceae bacterium]
MKSRRIDIASIRREQIVEAAIAIIVEQGLQNLSLSEIEQRAGMSRGQLMYYFHSKEEILLAVFDRLLEMMCRRSGTSDRCLEDIPGWWERLQYVMEKLLQQPPLHPEFHALQYTFLSQIGHREDFRQRLARLYEDWRGHIARDLAEELVRRPPRRPINARALATFVQALLHGLAVQLAADPQAYDVPEMKQLCLDVLGTYLWGRPPTASEGGQGRRNGHVARRAEPQAASRRRRCS